MTVAAVVLAPPPVAALSDRSGTTLLRGVAEAAGSNCSASATMFSEARTPARCGPAAWSIMTAYGVPVRIKSPGSSVITRQRSASW